MEIIKRGIDPKDTQINATCQNCKTEVRFHKAEAERVTDRNDQYWQIECPVCHKAITKDINTGRNDR